MRARIFLISLLLLAAPAAAQLGLPRASLPQTGTVIDPVTGTVFGEIEGLSDSALREVRRLADLRERRLDRLVRRNREAIEFDVQGEPARRGELLLLQASAGEIETARSLGYNVIASEAIGGIDMRVTRLAVPEGTSLRDAQEELAEALPEAEISADNLHFQSGAMTALPVLASASTANVSTPVGIIDGAPGAGIKVEAQRGFVDGAPFPSNHGTAIVTLLRHAGVRDVRVADVYGTDKAGGSALAIARGLGWLVSGGSKVINISLVGPKNRVVERAIAGARAKGVVVVAAVGNDGPAAPPAYPASYDGVVAVTAVDKRNRALIEAGRALHLDYAAPGADIYARNAKGGRMKLRGTSYATPFVAARIAAARQSGRIWRTALDREARDLGPKGPDATYGRGLVCASCRPTS